MYIHVNAVNIDKKEVHDIGEIIEPDYLDFGNVGIEFLNLFQKKKWRSVGELMEKEKIDYRKQGVPRGLGQLELPEELIDAIFGQIDDVWTAVRLGVANTRLLLIGEGRIQQLMGDPNWSGDRVICVDAHSDLDDEEEEEWERMGDEFEIDEERYEDDSNDDGEDNGVTGGNIGLPEGLDAGEFYGRFDPHPVHRWQSSTYNRKGLRDGFKANTLESRIAHALSMPVPVLERPPDAAAAPTVLWNLTKHVYVRADAIPTETDALPEFWECWLKDDDSKKDRENILGWILFLHVAWTEAEWVQHRKWVGDRFEWTGHDVLETRLKEDGCTWTDASEGAVQLFMDTFNRWG